jgi:Na+/phosphate symporter
MILTGNGSYAAELETIGDTIEKNLTSTVTKRLAENLVLHSEDETALNHLYQKTMLQFDLAASFITMREQATAQRVLSARDEINEWCLRQKKIHYEGLKPADRQSLSNSVSFLDMLDGLRRINNHLSAAAYGFSPTGVRQKRARTKPAIQNPAQQSLIPPAPEHP